MCIRDRIKPAQDTPLSTFNLVQALTDAGVPKGVINVVAGYGPEAGTPLLENPAVRAISFTGSSAVGKIIGTTAAKSFKQDVYKRQRSENPVSRCSWCRH